MTVNFTKAVELDPALAEICRRSSMICCAKEDYDRAWKDVENIKTLSYKVPASYLTYLRAASGR